MLFLVDRAASSELTADQIEGRYILAATRPNEIARYVIKRWGLTESFIYRKSIFHFAKLSISQYKDCVSDGIKIAGERQLTAITLAKVGLEEIRQKQLEF